jgi:catechol 2,3-dioxygenase-like lactoylglutathione lyase family enzyme
MVTDGDPDDRDGHATGTADDAGDRLHAVLTAFDHLVVAVRDLTAASDAYRRLGFDVSPGGRNPGNGTWNAIIRFGIDYIELLSIEDEALARDRAPSGRALRAYLESREGGAAAWVAQSDDIVADASKAERAGFEDIGLPIPMRRARPDGSEFAWQLLIPRGLAFRQPWPLLIEWTTSDAERLRLEPAGHHDNGVLGIRELSVVVPSVEEARTVYGTRLGVPLGAATASDALGATVVRTRIGDLELSLLAPNGAGVIERESALHGPGPFEVGLSVSDLSATRRLLRDRGISLVEGADGTLAIDPVEACGVRLRFRAHPTGDAQ